jgi:TM2 domain-containing membrane protein YozV
MHCTNCGSEVAEQATACPSCGVAPRAEKKFCHGCGVETSPAQVICIKCGVSISAGSTGKKKVPAGVLGILLGGIGAHKFYLGSWGWGIVYILLCWLYVPAVIGLIEGIIYLTMDEAQFDEKYNRSEPQPFRW